MGTYKRKGLSRLIDLYKDMETLRKEGLPVNEDLEKKANELEDVIVKNCRKIQLFENFEQLLQMRIYPIRFACLF